MFLQGTDCNSRAQAVNLSSTAQVKKGTRNTRNTDVAWYLGTERSPLTLFAGLQRSVTTALRPDSQDEVGSRDLDEKNTESKV